MPHASRSPVHSYQCSMYTNISYHIIIMYIEYIYNICIYTFSSNTNNKTTKFRKNTRTTRNKFHLKIKQKSDNIMDTPWSPEEKKGGSWPSHFTMPLTCWTPWTSLGRPQLIKASNASTGKLSAKELLHAASNGAGRAIAIKVSPFLKHLDLDWLFVRECEKGRE